MQGWGPVQFPPIGALRLGAPHPVPSSQKPAWSHCGSYRPNPGSPSLAQHWALLFLLCFDLSLPAWLGGS